MGFQIQPIEIAAIGSAALALLVLISVVIHHCTRRRRRRRSNSQNRSSSSKSQIHTTRNGSEITLAPFGYPSSSSKSSLPLHTGISSHSHGNTPIAPSPSTGQTTLLVTPTTSTPNSTRSKLKKLGLGTSPSPQLDKEREESMVVVTYEDGLRKLGIDPNITIAQKPHHILYPEDEDDTPPYSYTYDASRSPERIRDGDGGRLEAVDSPRSVPGRSQQQPRTQVQRVEATAPEIGNVKSTWLPSYYHSPSAGADSGDGGRRGQSDAAMEESDLGDGRRRWDGI